MEGSVELQLEEANEAVTVTVHEIVVSNAPDNEQ